MAREVRYYSYVYHVSYGAISFVPATGRVHGGKIRPAALFPVSMKFISFGRARGGYVYAA